uniref:Uncharacterized protein n=1 Tax=Anguilla anguilla TaxID=7936 RepID=A0A0E9RHC5_ANGAN
MRYCVERSDGFGCSVPNL